SPKRQSFQLFRSNICRCGVVIRTAMHRRRVFVTLLTFCGALLGRCAISRAATELKSTIDFAREIQPILSVNCYHCHGPDAARRKAELRFDTLDAKQGPFASRDGYSILVPGKLDDSVRILRIP